MKNHKENVDQERKLSQIQSEIDVQTPSYPVTDISQDWFDDDSTDYAPQPFTPRVIGRLPELYSGETPHRRFPKRFKRLLYEGTLLFSAFTLGILSSAVLHNRNSEETTTVTNEAPLLGPFESDPVVYSETDDTWPDLPPVELETEKSYVGYGGDFIKSPIESQRQEIILPDVKQRQNEVVKYANESRGIASFDGLDPYSASDEQSASDNKVQLFADSGLRNDSRFNCSTTNIPKNEGFLDYQFDSQSSSSSYVNIDIPYAHEESAPQDVNYFYPRDSYPAEVESPRSAELPRNKTIALTSTNHTNYNNNADFDGFKSDFIPNIATSDARHAANNKENDYNSLEESSENLYAWGSDSEQKTRFHGFGSSWDATVTNNKEVSSDSPFRPIDGANPAYMANSYDQEPQTTALTIEQPRQQTRTVRW